MAILVPALFRVEYRNFNMCPHCECRGLEPTLTRMCESMPMISRSDGRNFHLLLADRPLPFPVEKDGPSDRLSLCFWHAYNDAAFSECTVVLIPNMPPRGIGLFRHIEFIADLLVVELLQRRSLAGLYGLQGHSLRELPY